MNTPNYWDHRYKTGVGAGSGSRGRLYAFKLSAVQQIVNHYKVKSVVDVGCGDGVQLSELAVGKYQGLDVSEVAIDACMPLVTKDRVYQLIDEDSVAKGEIADMSISLDVIQHMPDDQYEAHLDLIYRLAKRYILIYAPDSDGEGLKLQSHMKFHKFTVDMKDRYGLEPIKHIKNAYPVTGADTTTSSYSEFFLFEKKRIKGKEK